MRKLSILLVLLLLSLLTAVASAASAHALSLPDPGQVGTLAAPGDEEEDEDEEAAEEDDEEAEDASEDGEDSLIAALRACEGAADEEGCEERVTKETEAEECLLESADASVKASPGSGKVRLTVRYRSFEPISVSVDARLRGAKGGLRLGQDRTRFRRSGVYRDTFKLGERQMAKALAARKFTIDLQAAGTPGYCAVHLTASRAGAKPRWS
ncbi:MAG TPA: hypothetical protein VK480_05865 [Solirubrobacterales bacterium]|nr:hypothetical protein [Solirubrobacterales bacterium]